MNIHRRRAVLSRAVRCEALERRMLLSLSPVGPEFRANTFTSNVQSNPAIAADADSDFVVAWESLGQDGFGYGIYAQRYNSAGVAQGAEFRANSATTNNQRFPSVAMDADGDFAVAWQSLLTAGNYEIFGQRYNAAGVPQGGEFRANTFTASAQIKPAIAADADGDFVVAWESLGQDGFGYGIYAQRYNSAGVVQGPEFRANTFTANNQRTPSVAMDADGDFVVAWESLGQDGFGYGIYAQHYNSAGAAQGTEFRVNSTTTNNQRFPSVTMDADGDAVVAWHSLSQDGSSYAVYAQRYDESNPDTAAPMVGGVFVSPRRVLPYSTHQGPLTQVVVSFSENMSDAGGPTGPNSVTNPANWLITRNGANVTAGLAVTYGFNPAANRFEALLTLADSFMDGNFLVKARDNIRDIAGNRLDGNLDGMAGGSLLLPFSVGIVVPRGGEFGVNTFTANRQGVPSVAMDANGDFVVAWESLGQDGFGYGIYAQRYNSAGVAQGPEFRANNFTTNNQRFPSVAMDADGDFVVAWDSANQDGYFDGVYAQRYNAAGTAQGGEFRVNTYTTRAQSRPVAAMDAAGNFVIAWRSSGQDGSDYGVYAQRFNAAGTGQGGEFKVNTFTFGNQQLPAVAMDASGDFVVAWQSFGQDGSELGIYAQRYNAAGVAQGSEFRVNTTTAEDQVQPVVAMDSDGDFVVVWHDYFNSFAQRFNAAGVAQGAEFRVNAVNVGGSVDPAVAMDADSDFVVAWFDYGNPIQYDVYARRYNAAGVAQGVEFRVNTFTPSRQSNPAVAMDAAGDFVVAWTSYQDGSNSGVYAQRYGTRNTPTVGTLSDTPDPVTGGNSITLSAGGVSSDGGMVNSVSFYRESNGEPGLQVGVEGDTLVATDTSPSGGFWSVSASTAGLAGGTYTYWAQATNGLTGAPASTTNTVTSAAPAVTASEFRFETAPHRLRFTFSDNVSASLGTEDILLENLTTAQTIPSGQLSLSYDSGTNTGTFTYTGPGSGITGVLPDGNYRTTLLAAGITNPGGTPLPANHVFTFFFLNGDANHDGRVNLTDFNILAANFGQSPRTFEQGDFTYDTFVNLADFNILASRFGTILAGPGDGVSTFGGGQSSKYEREEADLLKELLR